MTDASPAPAPAGHGDWCTPAEAVARGQGHGFPIERPLLSRGSADRSEDLRDPDRLVAAWPGALVLVVDPSGRVAFHDDLVAPSGEPAPGGPVPRLRLAAAAGFGDVPPETAVLLGRVPIAEVAVGSTPADPDGWTDVWGVPGEVADGGALREYGAILSDVDAGLLTTAVALLTWHRTGAFCPRCGLRSIPQPAGWSRLCDNGHQEFPRTDPAVIVLVHDGADRMVLARQPIWPAGRVSVLAGFVEAGESLEGTVVREIGEEVGVHVKDISYLGSQPWPFPRSLMVGFAARADPGAELVPRPGEIEDARWVDRATVRRILAAGGEAEGIALPGEVSIARRMIEGWAQLG